VHTVQKIAKNIGVITGNVIFRLESLFVTIYLARYIGTAGFGKYSFVLAYLVFMRTELIQQKETKWDFKIVLVDILMLGIVPFSNWSYKS
jgi:hypothetical protein